MDDPNIPEEVVVPSAEPPQRPAEPQPPPRIAGSQDISHLIGQ